MKRILLLTAAMLVWSGAVVAGELKVAVPVDEFKQMKSRLEALESDNGRLRQELNAVKGQERQVQAAPEVQARLEAAEKENRQLRESLQTRSSDKGSAAEDVGASAKLDAIENENRKLQQEVKILKEGVVAEAYTENKVSAREQYFLERRKGVSHVYKF